MRTVCVQRVSKALFTRHLRWKHAVHSRIMFIRRSRQIINARPANHSTPTKILHFLACWTCVMVCVTGPLRINIMQLCINYYSCSWSSSVAPPLKMYTVWEGCDFACNTHLMTFWSLPAGNHKHQGEWYPELVHRNMFVLSIYYLGVA